MRSNKTLLPHPPSPSPPFPAGSLMRSKVKPRNEAVLKGHICTSEYSRLKLTGEIPIAIATLASKTSEDNTASS